MARYQLHFEFERQRNFAQASLDVNPIHVDPVAARRTQVGGQVVHGMHAVLWALDCAAAERLIRAEFVLKTQFIQPIYVGDTADLELAQSEAGSVQLTVLVGSEVVLIVRIAYRPASPPTIPVRIPIDERSIPLVPDAPSVESLSGLSGRLAPLHTETELARLFPSLVNTLGITTVRSLAQLSSLVGMVVPGLHSLFLAVNVHLVRIGVSQDTSLYYSVSSVVQPHRLVQLKVEAPGLRGTVETISRLPPTAQPGIAAIQRYIRRDEFKDVRALVIGGSRGLGELTAKLLSVGGAHVTITYASGQQDAERVASDLRTAGCRCSVIPYDIRRSVADQLGNSTLASTQVYFFATPLIARRKEGVFDASRFAEFNAYYLVALYALVQCLAKRASPGIRVFVPSSSFVESRPPNMAEYAMSKAASEVLCSELSRCVPGVTVLTKRLPPLPTDQTNGGGLPSPAVALDVLVPIVREMNS